MDRKRAERYWVRRQIIEERGKGEWTSAELAKRYGVSRQSIYKWAKRAQSEGWKGLEDKSRRPKSHPSQQKTQQWEQSILELKRRRRSWGAKKLQAELKRRHLNEPLPSIATIGRILQRRGLTKVTRRRKAGPAIEKSQKRPQPVSPNAVWAIDFKGNFRLADHTTVYPLTIEDLYSRFLLGVQALGSTSQQQVKGVCERIFARYGLPTSILVDNGKPFCGDGLLGLSRLNVWWRRLGIEVYFIERGRPQQNGRLERLHRTLKAETTQPVSAHLNAQQRRFNRWRQHYNVQRPHEAIAQRYPSELYSLSERAFPSSLATVRYPAGWITRQVRGNGEIRLKGAHYFLTESLTGEVVGLQPQDTNQYRIYWNGLLLATLHPDSSQPVRLARYRKSPLVAVRPGMPQSSTKVKPANPKDPTSCDRQSRAEKKESWAP
jgi:putative transposase